MAVQNINKTDEGYVLIGTTNLGRPVQIELQLGDVRKVDVSVEPYPGVPFEEPFAETELHNVMAEHDAIHARISATFEMMPADAQDEELLAAIATVISRQKISQEVIEELTAANEQRMGM
ncbi:hypothetical protein [Mesorhizobium sp. SP-1A]|uniref:hypothetical protein n=1 Tax=Mesorhizobium sp. SP-1A TaxID=3077840 RepID=UPI0028F70894|nr:hypothetical protein [Mesorhizobium sp. SP-1A]